MNKYLKYILAFISPFVIVYFILAFIAFDFNAGNWDAAGRCCLVFFSLFIGGCLVLSIGEYEDQFRNEKQ